MTSILQDVHGNVVCILHTCINVYFLCPCVNSLFWYEIVKFSLIWHGKVLHSWWLCFCSLAYHLTQKTAFYLQTYLRYAGSLVNCDGIWFIPNELWVFYPSALARKEMTQCHFMQKIYILIVMRKNHLWHHTE